MPDSAVKASPNPKRVLCLDYDALLGSWSPPAFTSKGQEDRGWPTRACAWDNFYIDSLKKHVSEISYFDIADKGTPLQRQVLQVGVCFVAACFREAPHELTFDMLFSSAVERMLTEAGLAYKPL